MGFVGNQCAGTKNQPRGKSGALKTTRASYRSCGGSLGLVDCC